MSVATSSVTEGGAQQPASSHGDTLPIAETSSEAPAPSQAVGYRFNLLSRAAIVSELDQFADELAQSWPQLEDSERSQIRGAVTRLHEIAADRAQIVAAPSLRNEPPASWSQQAWLLVAGMALAVGWLVVFTCGFAVPSSPYVKLLNSGSGISVSLPAAVGSLAVVMLCSTPTNPGLLACIAALLGGIARWIHVDGSTPEAVEVPMSIQRTCFAATLRGFFMYLALLAGLLLLTTQAITNATLDQYVQLAGTVSVFGFMIGYDPDVFRKLMGKMNGWAAQRDNAGLSNGPVGAVVPAKPSQSTAPGSL